MNKQQATKTDEQFYIDHGGDGGNRTPVLTFFNVPVLQA